MPVIVSRNIVDLYKDNHVLFKPYATQTQFKQQSGSTFDFWQFD